MFRATRYFTILVLVGAFVLDADAGWFRRRRRRTTIIHQHYSTNNCNCRKVIQILMTELNLLKQKLAATEKKIAGRDVAAILNLEENYPGVASFVDHLNSKRGLIAEEDFADIVKRATDKEET